MVLWRAKQATIKIAPTIATISSSATIESQLTSAVDWSGEIKNIEISGAEADTETVYLFGASAGGQQNAEIEEQNMTQREFTGTLIYQDEDAAALATGTAASVGATDYNRIQGDGTRSQYIVFIKFTDGVTTAVAALNNSFSMKLGDISLDAEGHAEQEISLKCLAKDYYEESDAN